MDDDRLVCDTLTEMIQFRGLHAEGFTQPEAALAHIRENKCDVVLLDVFISDVSGLDLIPQISNEAPDGLKIIVITGSLKRIRLSGRSILALSTCWRSPFAMNCCTIRS